MFLFDYLMPAELFPIILIGSLLLLWATLRARSQRKPVVWGLIAMGVFLIGITAIAEVTGLASGAVEAEGWPRVLVIASIILYTLAVIEIGITGVFLLRNLYR